MTEPDLPSFAELRLRYAGEEGVHDDPPTVSLADALQVGDPWSVLAYLGNLSRPVTCLFDLEGAVNSLADEEELTAFRCVEGVALSAASDGRWLLFVE